MDVENEPDDSAAQRDEGDAGEGAAKQEADAGKKGAVSRSDDQAQPTEQQEDEAAREEPRQDPFKKLGDALERWHRQQTEIKEAEQKEEEGEAKQPQQDADDMAAKERPPEDKKDGPERDDGRSGVKTRQGAFDREATPEDADAVKMEDADEDEDEDEDEADNNMDEASAQLSETHLTGDPERPLRDFDEAMQLWTGFQTKTNALSQSLTSQLRLILNPSQSTKLSGIMIVFIVMDDTSRKDADSVLDLKEAKFVKDEMGNSKVVIERYLDTFPFQYYLIVHNLEELPNALAGLLRTWFAEVNA
ncbi:Exodeoxyribonuclease 1 [Verticillium dahliae VDG1]|nr:Exodeoxyribonuclease 1 [Verticillium dahliae VDG1]